MAACIRQCLLFAYLLTGIVSQANTVVKFQPADSCGKDALLASLWPDNNYGNHSDFIACAWTNQSNPSTTRAIVEFDINTIPSGVTIVNASLELFHYTSPFNTGHSNMSGPADGWLERITQPWTENTVTWNNQPATTTLNRVNVVAPFSMNQNYILDVTQLVRDMLNNPASSYGFMLKLQTESYYRSLLFASSDMNNPVFHPKLTVEYTEEILPLAGCWTNALITPDSIYTNPVTDPSLFVPNVFTPNADGMNDEFFPDTLVGISIKEIYVYNRWGQLIYQSIPAQPWNGKTGERECPDGTYYYLITASMPSGSTGKFSGYFTLLR